MIFQPLCSPLLLFGHSCDIVPSSVGVGILQRSPFQVHRGRIFEQPRCMGIGRL